MSATIKKNARITLPELWSEWEDVSATSYTSSLLSFFSLLSVVVSHVRRRLPALGWDPICRPILTPAWIVKSVAP